ncbi:MAG: uracil phosphoribosyltransferase [Saprospirales bacterium]|nr:MAG: uracil phosphoribosyltransferase [Saprospirales bacterium]
MLHNLSKNSSVINHYLAEIRDAKKQVDRLRFRSNIRRCGEMIAYELSKTLKYKSVEVETPLGVAKSEVLDQSVVIASILRAGLPFHQGFLNVFDEADNAFISAYRKHHKDGTFEIDLQYLTCPPLEDRVLILSDAMLATGASIQKTLQNLESYGKPSKVHIATIIASVDGIKYIRRLYPNAVIWACAVDEELTARSYIVPGLGDAGDLAFGEKLQE